MRTRNGNYELWTRFCNLWDFFSVKSWCVLHINIQIWFMWSYRHVFDFLLVNYAIRIKFPRDHSYITSAKGLGGSRKWPVSLTFSTVFMLIRWVGGVQKGKKICWRNIGMAPYLAKAWTCLNMSTYWIFLWSYCLLKKCKLKIDFSLSPTTLVSSPKSYLSAY